MKTADAGIVIHKKSKAKKKYGSDYNANKKAKNEVFEDAGKVIDGVNKLGLFSDDLNEWTCDEAESGTEEGKELRFGKPESHTGFW
ncbi:Hypothetical predicted protein [Octopus vulgaris]|uniref:Uncharacterized protein n=1 Tax=Octopus vulgaris TaxID=6645 RepID=A0AA36ANQ1_OCTVU|nr:Hypothetical predicted protein [Octopus vulgaris]